MHIINIQLSTVIFEKIQENNKPVDMDHKCPDRRVDKRHVVLMWRFNLLYVMFNILYVMLTNCEK